MVRKQDMLDLEVLGSGQIPSITPAVGNFLAEAAGVCLESQDHLPGVQLAVTGYRNGHFVLSWLPVAEQALRSWGHAERATEFGAEAVAILMAKKVIGFAVIECSRKGTGFDYWLGIRTESTFQRKARLEISGIRRGDESTVRTRMKKKLKQTAQSDEIRLPAYAIVVEFGEPLAQVQKK